MNRKKVLVWGLMLVCALWWLLWPVPCVVLENLNNGKVVFVAAMNSEDEITMGWTHSVELLPWEEIFRVENNKLIMDRTRFKTFGAGVPSVTLGKSKMEDGWVVFYDLEQEMPDLTYSISKRGKNILTYKNKVIPLYEVLPDATPVRVSANKTTQLDLYWRYFRQSMN